MDTTILSVGKPYPGALPGTEGNALSIKPDGTYMLLSIFTKSTPWEVAGFNSLWSFAIYDSQDLPGGLPMIAWKIKGKLTPIELPFDVALESQARLEGVLKRLAGSHIVEGKTVPSMTGLLVDSSTRILKAGKFVAPPTAWVRHLDQLWAEQPKHGNYDSAYLKLIQQKSVMQLWAEATKFPCDK